MENNKFLGEEKIYKLLIKFALPCILSLVISSLYNIVDQIFIGHSELGYLGNAATGIIFPLTTIACAFAWCFGDGNAANLSLSQGRGDTSKVHKAIGNGIVMTFLVSVIFIVFGFVFKEKLLYLFGASSNTIDYASDYFGIVLGGISIFMLGSMLGGIIRADGNPKYSMLVMLAGAITNIILDPIFIFALDWGIKGAAWATVIGQIISFVLAFIYLFRSRTFRLCKDSFKLDFKLFFSVVKLGISTFITQLSIVAVSMVCNIMLSKYGALSQYGSDIPIASLSICMKVFSILIAIIIGLVLGAQPILGYNYGAKNYDRVKKTFKTVIMIVIIIGIIFTLIFQLCPFVIINLFGNESLLYMEFATMTFRKFLMLIIFTSVIKVSSIFFQAVGKPLKAIIMSLIRDIVCFIPLVIILPRFWGIEGILYAAPIADMIGFIVAIVFVLLFFRKLNKDSVKEKSS